MKNIDKINKKLLYEKFYNFSSEDWVKDKLYYNTIKQLANDEQFIEEFKDKIDWEFFIFYSHPNWDIIEKYIDYYDECTWRVIFYSPYIYPEFINKYYKHITFNIDNTRFAFENLTLINSEVVNYLLENHYLTQSEFYIERDLKEELSNNIINNYLYK